ncbi:MAG TPA: VWA domain-containing protein [Leptospiraceae bacterium]|nr:VWA domain-containing protein [Leptospiraceae bacterium]HNF25177.1 VWA domain-containing protein [Leptospiraceae bacterium]
MFNSFKNLNSFSVSFTVLVFIVFLIWVIQRVRSRMIIKEITEIHPSLKKSFSTAPNYIHYIRFFIIFLILGFCSFALLNPSFSKPAGESERKSEGVDILFLIDVSLSMYAVDAPPSRLQKVKESILHLLPSLEGNRLGIITFAGTAFLYCPMTKDLGAFSDFLRGLEADMIPDTGTDMQKAFAKAEEVIESKKILRNRILVLITDGENKNQSFPKIKNADMIVIGVGTSQGDAIYYRDESAKLAGYVTKSRHLVQRKEGDLVISKADEEYLAELASKNSAVYRNLSREPDSMQIIKDKISEMEKNQSEDIRKYARLDGYQYFLYPAVLFLLIDLLFMEILLKKILRKKGTV